MFITTTSDRSCTTVTKGRNRQSRASMVGGSNLNGLPVVASANQTTASLETSALRHFEFLQDSPSGPGRNPSAIDRIWKCHEVEAFGNRFARGHGHFSCDGSPIGDLNFLICPGGCASSSSANRTTTAAASLMYASKIDPDNSDNFVIVPNGPHKAKGGSLAASPFVTALPSVSEDTDAYFAATGITCVALSNEALFMPAPAPARGSNRWSPAGNTRR